MIIARGEQGSLLSLIPAWEEMGNKKLREGATPKERAETWIKFTKEEVCSYLEFCTACPELPLSVITTQGLLGAYLTELRGIIARTHHGVAAALELFQQHWIAANNFPRFFTMSLYLSLPDRSDPLVAFQALQQKTVEAAFQFLEDSRAFDFIIPTDVHVLMRGGAEHPLRFSCPAQPFLRELIVCQGSLFQVIQTIRSLRDSAEHDLPGAERWLSFLPAAATLRAFLSTAHYLIREKGMEAYKMLVSMEPQSY